MLDGLVSTSPPSVLLPRSLCNDWILEGLASADPASKECFICRCIGRTKRKQRWKDKSQDHGVHFMSSTSSAIVCHKHTKYTIRITLLYDPTCYSGLFQHVLQKILHENFTGTFGNRELSVFSALIIVFLERKESVVKGKGNVYLNTASFV